MFLHSMRTSNLSSDKKPLSFVLVKPAGPDCNIDCSYCFYHGKCREFSSGMHRMDEGTLEELVKQAIEQSPGRIGFGWQGGEPTLMGLDFYRKAVSLQKAFGKNTVIENSIQTNGLLTDRQWADFLRDNKFLIGLSIDGPPHVHDRYRKTAGGKGTFDAVQRAAEILLDAGADVNALSVVTSYSVHYAEEIYRTLKKMGLTYMQFIPCIEHDPADPRKPSDFSVDPEELGDFFCTLFDLWTDDFHEGRPTTSVRFFESLLFTYAGEICPDCTFRRTCGDYLVVEHNGDVYSCDFFVEDTWKLGSIHSDTLVNMLNSRKQTMFGELKLRLQKKCLKCQWLHICRGGCTKDRLRCAEDKRISHFCSAYKKFFSYSSSRMKVILKNARPHRQ